MLAGIVVVLVSGTRTGGWNAVDDVDHGALLDALKSLDGVEICSYQSLPLAADRDHVQKREVLYSTGIAASDNKQSTNLRIVESRVTAEIYVTLWTPAPESQY